ncbi:DNA phosphorothioation-dependent restriction protein DptF [Ferrimonas balearica]|uniref:DNA phosphorothioation-dependent restriction protein DptF n=1 Tax=Ferrimonas balearica TaxID=44012 RepID=UPI001C97E39D|nr:DNA phosphorothioation-dependent restriction protein DptF [Ferrimonas balearica]MBY5980534.1 DNA phosphorothioation-dependent restriction protein DptF [Ferrimonas balearica]
MERVSLRQALSVLSKSSPFSVSTVKERQTDFFDELKGSLYVTQAIETDFEKLLASASRGDIIFLCGSSGDGKSEILTRHYDKSGSRYRFHLDATHSFSPRQSAIEALNQLFDERIEDNKPLVIGINIGMLANFAKEGAERHSEIRAEIESFLSQEEPGPSRYSFLDFENYPKFSFSEQQAASSEFTKALLNQLTRQDESNPFYCIALGEEATAENHKLLANFKMLAVPEVQDVLITNLFKLRLKKDQFITTRALLDLLHHLLLEDGYLWDNLFSGGDDELLQRLAELDPANLRTQQLDQLVLRYELGLPDPELDSFIEQIREKHIALPRIDVKQGDAGSLIRLLYLIKDAEFANGYHKRFQSEFNDVPMEAYASMWQVHKSHTAGNQETFTELRQFYAKELIAAVYRYANRKAPELGKKELFLGQYGQVKLAAPVEVKGNYNKIAEQQEDKCHHFHAHFKVMNTNLKPVQISLGLFELIRKINRGYRPNRYDKSVVVLLDEMVDQITEIAKQTQTLKFYEGSKQFVATDDDGMITAEEIAR